jgi:WD40 repeat protein
VWDPRNGERRHNLTDHNSAVVTATFSPDGGRILTSSEDGTGRIYSTVDGNCLLTLQGHGDAVRNAVFAPDGSAVATISNDRTGRVWDAESGACVMQLRGHTGAVRSLAFAPFYKESMAVATGSDDATVRLWCASFLLLLLPSFLFWRPSFLLTRGFISRLSRLHLGLGGSCLLMRTPCFLVLLQDGRIRRVYTRV